MAENLRVGRVPSARPTTLRVGFVMLNTLRFIDKRSLSGKKEIVIDKKRVYSDYASHQR